MQAANEDRGNAGASTKLFKQSSSLPQRSPAGPGEETGSSNTAATIDRDDHCTNGYGSGGSELISNGTQKTHGKCIFHLVI